MQERFIGLMSGTSMDGVDGVVADLSGGGVQVLAHASAPFPTALRDELMALNTPGGVDELHRAWLAGNGLMRVYAQVVQALLDPTGLSPRDIEAIGAHGQTVRHRPQQFDGTGYTIQLAQPALLAECTGIRVVADFRSRDVAAGGQGAPLAPFFHQALFARAGQTVGVLNIGGISNLTVLRADGSMQGFDCGPGNATHGARSTPASRTTTPGASRLAATCCRTCWRTCWPSPISRSRRPRAPGATCSTGRGWTPS